MISVFNHKRLPFHKQPFKPTRIKYVANENNRNQNSDYIQMLKVGLDQFPAGKVIELLSNLKSLNFLCKKIIFTNVIDFTSDFSGLIKPIRL